MNKFLLKYRFLFVVTLFLAILNCSLFAQQTELIIEIKGDFNLFYTDNLRSVYAVSGNQLVRYNEQGKALFKTGYLNLGNITSADFTYTLKPVIFHQDYLSVAILDNTLSLQGNPLNLMDVGFSNAMLVCSSFDNNLWIYNQDNFEFLRVNFQLNTVSRTGSMQQILGREIEPNYMLERNNNLYVNDSRIGILVFDIFGTYYKTIGEKNIDTFQVFDDNLFFTRDNKLECLNLLTLSLTEIMLPIYEFKQVRVEKNRLYILDNEGIKIYKHNLF